MRAHRLLGRWLAVVACIAGLAGAQGAAAQPLAVPSAGPPVPNLPQGFVLKFPPNCKEVGQFGGNVTPQPINDFGTPGSVVTSTSVLTQSMPYIYTVLVETFITHTYASDLDISLISPAGTKVTLSHRNGDGNDNVFSGTVWSDFAVIPATDAVYQNNVAQMFLVPEEAMGAFQGESGTGTWSLVVSDLESEDTGTLLGWLIQVDGLNEPPITTTTHFSQTNGTVVTDTGSLDANIPVSGLENTLLNAKLTTDISHLKPGQLVISLSAPAALTTTISISNGANLANWFAGTKWYDKAGADYPPGPVTMAEAVYPTSPLTGTVPEGAMGHFLGTNPNGLWDLHLQDRPPAPGFTLNSWALDITTAHCLAHDYLPTVSH